MSTSTNPTEATIDRVVETMNELGIELHRAKQDQVAAANINGLAVTFAVLGSVIIVRAEADSGLPSQQADATWYLAANQLNSVAAGARAVIVDSFDTLIVRTERSLSVSAGITDEQLLDGLRRSLDSVIATHDAVRSVADEITEQMRSK